MAVTAETLHRAPEMYLDVDIASVAELHRVAETVGIDPRIAEAISWWGALNFTKHGFCLKIDGDKRTRFLYDCVTKIAWVVERSGRGRVKTSAIPAVEELRLLGPDEYPVEEGALIAVSAIAPPKLVGITKSGRIIY